MDITLYDIIDDMVNSVPRSEWGRYLDENSDITSGDKSEMSDWLTSRAVLLCELAEYIDNRGGSGCGDSGHDSAMKKAQKERKKIRKAIGYSYP